MTVTGEPLSDAAEGDAWIEATLSDRERAPAEIRDATRLINRALHALRAGARDPLIQEVGASKALAIRIGHGTGQELAEGRWTAARELPRMKIGRVDTVEPQTRVAAVLAGRDEVHPAETLILRARLDLEQGRDAEARYGLRAARAALEDRPSDDKYIRKQIELVERKLAGDT